MAGRCSRTVLCDVRRSMQEGWVVAILSNSRRGAYDRRFRISSLPSLPFHTFKKSTKKFSTKGGSLCARVNLRLSSAGDVSVRTLLAATYSCKRPSTSLMVWGSASPERISCNTAVIQLFTLTCATSSGLSRRSFWRSGSAMTATSWLGSRMFSIFLTNDVALSISSRVTDCYIYGYYSAGQGDRTNVPRWRVSCGRRVWRIF